MPKQSSKTDRKSGHSSAREYAIVKSQSGCVHVSAVDDKSQSGCVHVSAVDDLHSTDTVLERGYDFDAAFDRLDELNQQ